MGILKWLIGKNNLYYPGCVTKAIGKSENYKQILRRIGVSFITTNDKECCGLPVLNAGYDKETRKLVLSNLQKFKKNGVSKIITSCPSCFNMFSKEYSRIAPEWNIDSEHIVITILNKLKSNPRLIKKLSGEKIIYHDPCYLGRYSGVYEEPREILRLLGYEVVELINNKENALCCGAGGNLKKINKNLSIKISKKIFEQAKKTGVIKIVTTCPQCFSQFKENFNIEVLEFSDVVLGGLS